MKINKFLRITTLVFIVINCALYFSTNQTNYAIVAGILISFEGLILLNSINETLNRIEKSSNE